jgi:ectoine hydroxylase-related dioxygenase (phytanoyl-CoA dioxygenase family)
LPGRLDDTALVRLRDGLERLAIEQSKLAPPEEAGIVRAPLAFDDAFLALATDPAVLAIAESLLGGYTVLGQQNGLLPAPGHGFGQARWHRDLPYQNFTSSRPIALSALFCLDSFSTETGATLVLNGSHRSAEFPGSDGAIAVVAEAGDCIMFDAMLFHRTGENRTDRPRRAVNHVYGRGFVAQQIDLPGLLGGRFADEPTLARLLGYRTRPATSLPMWWARAHGASA